MNILISIKPKYAAQIYDKTKRFEIRKRLPKHLSYGDTIYFYESGTGLITGSACVDCLIFGTPDWLYRMHHKKLGIGYNAYQKYVGKAINVYFIKLVHAKRFDTPFTLQEFHLKRAPQSFCYLR